MQCATGQFQSRNRESSYFNVINVTGLATSHPWFQSRNRESSYFNWVRLSNCSFGIHVSIS